MVSQMAMDSGLDALPRRRLSGKRLILGIFLPLFVVVGLGIGLYYSLIEIFTAPPVTVQKVDVGAQVVPGQVRCVSTFEELPSILVNLSSSTVRRQAFMKVRISLELCRQEDKARVQELMPRVIDNLQTYLRDLRVDDLRSSAGFQRLREELRYRISLALQSVQVRDVLFQELLIQ